MTKIPMGTTRPASNPWLTITDGDWTTKVLRAYSSKPDAPYARWLCEVTPQGSPFSDVGDTYIRDIDGRIVQIDPSVPNEALPSRWQDLGSEPHDYGQYCECDDCGRIDGTHDLTVEH